MPCKYCFSLYHVTVCIHYILLHLTIIKYFAFSYIMLQHTFSLHIVMVWNGKQIFYSSFFHLFYSIFNLLQLHDHHYLSLHQHQQLHLYLHQYQQDQMYHVTISINKGLFTDIYSTINKKFHYFI